MKCTSAVALTLFSISALADENDFCAERPGQTTPPCVLEPGGVMIETAAASWIFTNDIRLRSDTVLIGDSLLRVGVTRGVEVQFGWTPAGYVRVRDRTAGTVATATRTGDVRLGLLYGPAGQDGPVAVQGFVSLPAGRSPIGAEDWGGGLRLPVSLPVAEGFQFALTPELDAAVNASGSGRHPAYGSAAGVGYALTGSLQLGVDVAVFRDEAPAGASTSATAGPSLAWQASSNTQFDVGGAAGLNRHSPDMQIYFGISHRF